MTLPGITSGGEFPRRRPALTWGRLSGPMGLGWLGGAHRATAQRAPARNKSTALSSTTISASMQDQCLRLPRRVHERRRRDTDKHKGTGFAPLQQHTFACSVCKPLPVLFANSASSLQSLVDPPTTKRVPHARNGVAGFGLRFRVSRCTFDSLMTEISHSVKKLQREASGFPPHFTIRPLPPSVS